MKRRTALGQCMLAREYFTGADIWRREREHIFQRSWLLAGHVSALPKSGAYFLFEHGTDSVIVLRDDTGRVRAHHNFCRHRGTRLCHAARGQFEQGLRCPYHAWTYALDGTLRGAPNMRDVSGFDLANWGLKPVALHEWRGFLFVNLAAAPMSFDVGLAGLAGKFAHWPLETLRSAQQTVYEVEANWKLLFHNYSECYHCPVAHPQLNRLTPYRNTQNDLDEGPVLGGPMGMNDTEGSMTTHGQRCAAPFATLSAEERGHVYYYTLFPSAFLSLHPDYVLVHRAQPLTPERTRIVCDWYFHPEAMAAPGFDATPAIDFWDLTNRQDWTLCANAQSGIRANVWEPGPYSELESQLAAFDRHYLRAIDEAAQEGNK
jgi:Rieske 2Fe-2S family protein